MAKDVAVNADLVRLPDGFARVFVHRHQKRRFARPLENDQGIFVEHGATAVSPAMQNWSEFTMPKFLAVKVVGHDAGRGKMCVDGFSIGDGRACRIAMIGDSLTEVLRVGTRFDRLVPEDLAAATIKTEHV